jgi:hypothetical protein
MSHKIKIDAKEHKVASVTVYQTNRAVIQRRFPVELKVRTVSFVSNSRD